MDAFYVLCSVATYLPSAAEGHVFVDGVRVSLSTILEKWYVVWTVRWIPRERCVCVRRVDCEMDSERADA